MSETIPAAALPAKWRADAQRLIGYPRVAALNDCADELDASLHAQAEPPAPTIAEMVAALPLGWNKGHPLMPGGTYATDSVCVDTGWLTQVIALLSELRKTKEPVPSSATTIARERAYAFQWCLEHNQGDLGRREDCRECQLPAQNLRDAIAAVQRSTAPEPTGDRALRAVIANYLRAAIRTCDTTDGPVAAVDRMADVIEESLPALPVATETPTTCEVCGAPFSFDDMGVKMLTGGHRHYRRCLNAHQKKESNNAD